MPVLFCAMRYINVGRYRPGSDEPELDCVRNTWKNNVGFFQLQYPDGTADFQSPRVLAMLALQKNVDEELCCDYGNPFTLIHN